jgi:hypothetical protein
MEGIRFFFSTDFSITSTVLFHENQSNGSLVVESGRTDMTQLTAIFGNLANAPKKRETVYLLMPKIQKMRPK